MNMSKSVTFDINYYFNKFFHVVEIEFGRFVCASMFNVQASNGNELNSYTIFLCTCHTTSNHQTLGRADYKAGIARVGMT